VGDLNPGKQFYKVKPSLGALMRFNINKRYSIRLSGYYITLSGDEADFPDRIIPYPHRPSFTSNLLDFSSQLEFNFLPYITGEDKWLSSTYVAGGIGYSFGLSDIAGFMTIPFGVGAKINITERLSTGVEWSFRKTFYDRIDDVSSPMGNSTLHNNDWYSTFGLFITYKFFKFAADCPAYKRTTKANDL
jgi:hypothetical protein